MSSPSSSTSSPSTPSTFNDSSDLQTPRKRVYEKPGFMTSQAFERQSLSCAGCLNQTASFPIFCGMRS